MSSLQQRALPQNRLRRRFIFGGRFCLADTLESIVGICKGDAYIVPKFAHAVNSRQRAVQQLGIAAVHFLVEKGINESRIVTSGKGDTEPVATNKTPEGRAQNRRIEFIRTDIK